MTHFESVRDWRLRLGVTGRQMETAIVVASRRMKLSQWPRVRAGSALSPEAVNADEMIEFFDLQTEQRRRLRLRKCQVCNDPQLKTRAFLVFQRPRGEYERDRRLGRYIASPIETATLVKF